MFTRPDSTFGLAGACPIALNWAKAIKVTVRNQSLATIIVVPPFSSVLPVGLNFQ
jgi:hypothetical protein